MEIHLWEGGQYNNLFPEVGDSVGFASGFDIVVNGPDFWAQFAAVNCVETVDQEKLDNGGKVVYRQQSQFDYLAVLQLTGTDFLVDESRIPIAEPKSAKNISMMLTRGFSTLEFIFHPFFQSGEVRLPRSDYPEMGSPIGDKISIEIQAPDLCPRYSATLVTNIGIKPSPGWMQERLKAAGFPVRTLTTASALGLRS